MVSNPAYESNVDDKMHKQPTNNNNSKGDVTSEEEDDAPRLSNERGRHVHFQGDGKVTEKSGQVKIIADGKEEEEGGEDDAEGDAEEHEHHEEKPGSSMKCLNIPRSPKDKGKGTSPSGTAWEEKVLFYNAGLYRADNKVCCNSWQTQLELILFANGGSIWSNQLRASSQQQVRFGGRS